MNNEIQVSVDKEVSTLEILKGEALPRREPVAVGIKGIIDTPTRFLEKRKTEITEKECHILVDRDKMTIALSIDEASHFKGSITGALEKHPDFDKWNINQGSEWGTKTLSEFIKMNRSSFKSKETAMELSSALQNLRVKTDKEIEKSDDNKGSYKVAIAQNVISTSIPDSFMIEVPIFKGQPKKEIQVEIYVNPDNFQIGLISPEANDIIDAVKNTAIDDELTKITECCKDIVIIEQ